MGTGKVETGRFLRARWPEEDTWPLGFMSTHTEKEGLNSSNFTGQDSDFQEG